MTDNSPKPWVTVVHSLPGRVRMRLSQPPADVDGMIAFVREHPGMGPISYTARTASILISFDPRAITTDEITLRTAFGYAIDRGCSPVRLLAAPEQVTLQNSAVLSGIGVFTALAMQSLDSSKKSRVGLQWIAGLGTAWSVLDHGWRELRTRGYFDPEVLALAYLVASFVRGNVLTASVVTWLATFSRHLIEMPSTGVTVEPVMLPGENGQQPRYEIVVGPDVDAPDRLRLGIMGFLNSVARYAMTGGGAHGMRSFWEELREVSHLHGEVLEGFGRHRGGIPVRFR